MEAFLKSMFEGCVAIDDGTWRAVFGYVLNARRPRYALSVFTFWFEP